MSGSLVSKSTVLLSYSFPLSVPCGSRYHTLDCRVWKHVIFICTFMWSSQTRLHTKYNYASIIRPWRHVFSFWCHLVNSLRVFSSTVLFSLPCCGPMLWHSDLRSCNSTVWWWNIKQSQRISQHCKEHPISAFITSLFRCKGPFENILNSFYVQPIWTCHRGPYLLRAWWKQVVSLNYFEVFPKKALLVYPPNPVVFAW